MNGYKMNAKEINFNIGDRVRLIYDWKSGAGVKFGVYKAGSFGTAYAIGETTAFCQLKMDDGKIIEVNAYEDIEIATR